MKKPEQARSDHDERMDAFIDATMALLRDGETDSALIREIQHCQDRVYVENGITTPEVILDEEVARWADLIEPGDG